MEKILIFTLLIMASVHGKDDVDHKGVFFKELDKILFSSDSWNLIVDINTAKIRQSLQDIDSQVDRVDNLGLEVGTKIGTNYRSELEALLTEIKTTLKLEIQSLYKRLDNLELLTIQADRTNRGVFDGIGYGLHFIAGVATDGQVQDLNDKIENVRLSQGRMFHHLGEQLTYLNESATTIRRHDSLLHSLKISVNFVEQSLETADNRTRNELAGLDHRMRSLTAVQAAHTLLSHNLNALDKEITRLYNLNDAALAGRLTPALLDPENFLHTLVEISQKLPQGYNLLALPNKKGLPLLYSSALVRLHRLPHGLRFFINLPIRSEGRFFTIHEVQTSPQLYPGFNKSVEIMADAHILGVSEDQMNYVLLPTNYMSSCHAGDISICTPEFPIRGIDYPSCVIAAYRGLTSLMAELCPKRIIQKQYSVFLPSTLPGVWRYSVSEPTKLSLRCQPLSTDPSTTISDWLTIEGHGQLTLEPGCSAYHPRHTLLSTAIFSKNQKIDSSDQPALIKGNFSIPLISHEHTTVQSSDMKQWEPYFQTLNSLDTRQTPGIPLSLLSQETSLYDPFSLQPHQHKSILWGVITTLLSLLSLAVLVILLWVVYKKLPTHYCQRTCYRHANTALKPRKRNIIYHAPTEQVEGTAVPLNSPNAPEEEEQENKSNVKPNINIPTFFYPQLNM